MSKTIFKSKVWEELLKRYSKSNKLPTIQTLAEEYDISLREANKYRFAFENRFSLLPEKITKDSKLMAACFNSNREAKQQIKNLIGEIKLLEEKVNFLMALDNVDEETLKPIMIEGDKDTNDECTAYIVLSDAHIDEVVEPSVVRFINKYNPKIAESRLNLFFSRTIWTINQLKKGGWNIKKIVLVSLGDLFSGYIHEELMENNSMSPTEAVVFLIEIITSGIKTLANIIGSENLTVLGMRGNHTRTTKKKRFSTNYKNSYEYMMFTIIKKKFNESKDYSDINFFVPKSEFALVKVYDKVICNSHGDHFNYRGGVGGVTVPCMTWAYKQNRITPADRFVIGHWHTYHDLPSVLINGSVIGYSPFGMGKGFQPEDPQQIFQLIDKKRGFTINMPIKLVNY